MYADEEYLAGLVLVDGVVVALVAGAAPVLQTLDLLNQTRHAHPTLTRLILRQ